MKKTTQEKQDHEAEKAANHFIRWAKKRLPKGTTFDLSYTEADIDINEKPYFYLNVGVRCSDVSRIRDIEEEVLELAKQYGLTKQFEWSGSGFGFGFRDVGFIQKGRN